MKSENTITYKSQNSFVFDMLLGVFPVVSIVCLLAGLVIVFRKSDLNTMSLVGIALMVLTITICALMVHVRLHTCYTITVDVLIVTTGIFKRKVRLSSIRKIKYPAKHDLVGNRPALGMNGMWLYVLSGFNLFVSPENPQDFIDDLLKVNPDIQVVKE